MLYSRELQRHNSIDDGGKKWAHKKFSIIYLRIRFAVYDANKLSLVTWSEKAEKKR